jgi:hypothetical protein
VSEFARDDLPALLAEVFDRCCPPGQTWRCDRLEVDLGRILVSHADAEIPRRLVAELTRALGRRFSGTASPAAAATPKTATDSCATEGEPAGRAENGDTVLDLLDHLLRRGSLPWWQTDPAPFLSLWEQALATQPGNLLARLKRLAQQNPVRRRLVWHLGRTHLPALIALAEPIHAGALVEWVDALVTRHVEDGLVQDDASGFEMAAWETLLTCLFVDRGSQFNTTEFARFHLRHLAKSYGVTYVALLARLDQICTRQASRLPPRFLGLIRAVLDRDAAPPLPASRSPASAEAEAEWRLWAQMLTRGQAQAMPAGAEQAGGIVRLPALFSRLADRDEWRLARSMLVIGGPAGAVLARHLDDRSLRRTVMLLQPDEADFIIAHVVHSQRLAQRRYWPRRAVWEVVLTFLLAEHASRFERRQMVEQTLRESCRRHNTPLATALALMIGYAQVASPDQPHYQLLQILLDLQRDLAPAGETSGGGTPFNGTGAGVPIHPGDAAALAGRLASLAQRLHTGAGNDPMVTPFAATTPPVPAPHLNTRMAGAAAGATTPYDQGGDAGPSDRATIAGTGANPVPPGSDTPAASATAEAATFPAALVWRALRWRLRLGRAAPDLPQVLRQIPLDLLWERLPAAELRRWLLAQPDRAHLLPQLATLPSARRWLSRLTPPALRPIDRLLDQAASWFSSLGGGASIRPQLEPIFWHLALDPQAGLLTPARFLAQCLLLWCHALTLSVADSAVRGLAGPPSPAATSPLWREAFLILQGWADGTAIAPVPGARPGKRPNPDAWGQWLETAPGQEHLLRVLCRNAAPPLHRRHGVARLPAIGSAEQRLAATVYQWAWTRPARFRDLLARPWHRAAVQTRLEPRLRQALALPHLLDLIGREGGAGGGNATQRLIAGWQDWQRRLDLPHAAKREEWLWRTLWSAWLHQDWRALEPVRLLAAFRQFFLPLAGGSPSRLEEKLRDASPPAAIAACLPPPKPKARPTPRPPADDQRLPVTNAGLVLINSYLPALFDRLGLTQDRRFKTQDARHRAILALHFLATGFTRAEEPHLALNKILCGLDPAEPVPLAVDFPEAEINLMQGLLQAVLRHWSKAGTSSLDGFRGTWLLRGGILCDNDDHWGLTVTRKPWDILLSKSPFSYAVINLQWMEKPAYVTWPC